MIPETRRIEWTAPLDAAQAAATEVRARLFPFRIQQWLLLGFVAFLDQCGRAGVQFPNSFPGSGVSDGKSSSWGSFGQWLANHWVLVTVGVAAFLAFVLLLTALILWVQSRGTFVYIHNVARNEAVVGRPWREYSAEANSYFAWIFAAGLLLLGLLFLFLGTLAGGGWWLWHTYSHDMGRGLTVLIVFLVLFVVLIPAALVASLFYMLMRDFIAPIQAASRIPCSAAWRLLLPILRANMGAFAFYVLLKMAFSVALFVATVIAGCCTCCCGFLPVIHQTLLQPLYYFERGWSLQIVQRLGFELTRR